MYKRKNAEYRPCHPVEHDWNVHGWKVDQYDKKIGVVIGKDGEYFICEIKAHYQFLGDLYDNHAKHRNRTRRKSTSSAGAEAV